MSKITLTNISSLTKNPTTATSEINSNFQTIQAALDNTLSRDGTSPNQIENTIDMNSNQIINLPTPMTGGSPARLQDLSTLNGAGTVTNIPTGGTTGQILSKTSNTDFAVGWVSSSGISAGTNITTTGSNPTTIATIADPTFSTSVTTPEVLNSSGILTMNTSGTVTVPNVTDTLVGKATTDTLSNKTIDTASNTVKIAGTSITSTTGSGAVVLENNPSLSGVALSSLATEAAYSIVGNTTSSVASPTAFTIGGLTQKSSPASTDLLLIQDQASSGALKYAQVSSIASAGSVSSIAGNTGTFTLSGGVTNNINAIELNGAYTGFANSNIGLSASVASNILTVNLTDNAGSTPSSTSPVFLNYRNSTASTGSTAFVAQTSALSISTYATGATLGTASSVPFRIWVVCFNNSGTNVLALWQSVSGGQTPTALAPLNEAGIASASSMTGSATSAGTFYCPNGTTITSMPYRILGYLEWSSGLTTAGTYASGPTTIQVFGSGIKKPGDVLQTSLSSTKSGTNSSSASYTSQLTGSITPQSQCNLIDVSVNGNVHGGGGLASGAMTLFRGVTSSGTKLISSTLNNSASSGVDFPGSLRVLDNPITGSSQTYSLGTYGDGTHNAGFGTGGDSGAAAYGYMILSEIMT